MLAARSIKSVLRPRVARSFAASPWGGESWRYDKKEFIQFCKDTQAKDMNSNKRQFYGFMGVAFGDVDANKDGFITAQEFDLLCEKVAALPRRFGLAPSWEKEYGGDANRRKEARRVMFDALDSRNGPARGVIGMKQFMRWANDHVAGKIATVDTKSRVDFYNIEDYDEATFLAYLEHALTNPQSSAFATFYEFLLTIFIEADVECKGTINRNEFNGLLTRAAHVPRFFGLAPADSDEVMRTKIFASMDENGEGYVTFRKFLQWTVEHCKLKIELQKAGKGYKK